MKSLSCLLINGICLWMLCATLVAQDKSTSVDPSGTWRWEYELDGQTLKDSVSVNLGKDNAVEGTYRGRSEKPVAIKDGKMTGDTLSFHFAFDYQGREIKVEFKGKVKGDEIDGSVAVSTGDGSRDYPWTPKRSVQMEDVLGTWQMKIETGDRTLEPSIEITKDGDKYKGRYRSGDRIDVEATNLKIEGNQLLFSIAADINGTKLKGDYKGRPYGDKIKGSIAYELGDQSGDIEFTGAKKK